LESAAERFNKYGHHARHQHAKEGLPVPSRKRPRQDPIDAHVGRRVQLARKAAGLSQTELAQQLGLSFQQVQKYEKGANRIGAGRLLRIACLLNVPVSFFFDDLPQELSRAIGGPKSASASASNLTALAASGDVVSLISAYSRIEDKNLRQAIAAFVRATAQTGRGSAA